MNLPLPPELYDPPSYGGTPQQEAHAEMVQIFGSENPDSQWILTDYDVWEKNPYYHGPEQQHPEDDTPCDQWKPFTPQDAEEDEGQVAQDEHWDFLVGCNDWPF